MPLPAIDRNVALLGTGRALPKRRITNDDLRPIVKHYDAASGDFSLWVDRVTHIQERYWIDPLTESAGSLGLEAARAAVAQAGIRGDEIDQVIFCSFTYHELFPGEQIHIARALGANCGAFAMTAACAGSIFGLTLGRSLVASGQCRNVVVIGSECLSRATNVDDPITAILFGDAAGAMVIGRKTDGESTGFIGRSILRTEFNQDAISMRNGNAPTPEMFIDGDWRNIVRPYIKMEGGPRVLRNAVTRMSDVVVECLGFTPQDLKDGNPELRELLDRAKIVPHQANGRIVDGLQEKLGCPRANVYRTIYFAGNSSAGTNPFTLDYAIREGNVDRLDPPEGSTHMGQLVRTPNTIQKGDLVVIVSIGAGY
ncbi:MAG: ketoacyl-ACP synthase III, partial [Planctomycetes bacterium]|nr:ketoacyl-ACP synthase III [Planctomycetota bacterium]